MPVDEWLDEPSVVSIQWIVTIIKRNGVPIHPTTWINLENCMLQKRHQAQQVTDYVIPFT